VSRVAIATGAYVAMVALLSTVAMYGAMRTAPHPAPDPPGPAWFDAWYRYDSGWYWDIAQNGYWYTPGIQSPIAFFPAYPMTVRLVSTMLPDVQVAAQLVTWACGLASLALFARWVFTRLPRSAAWTALTLLAVYPYAYYLYGTGYADSMFLFSALAALTLCDQRRYWAAGLVGMLATAGRPVGLAVAVGLTVRMLELEARTRLALDDDERVPWRELFAQVRQVRLPQIGVLAAGLGLAGWCAYLWVAFGDPLAWIAVQGAPGWNQGSGPYTWFKVPLAWAWARYESPMVWALTAQGFVCLLAILLLRPVLRRFGWGYAGYVAVVIAIPILGTGNFIGCGRYMMMAFPAFAAAGAIVAERSAGRVWLRPLLFTVMACALFVATYYYAWGFEVS
jgi:hypothetical protein